MGQRSSFILGPPRYLKSTPRKKDRARGPLPPYESLLAKAFMNEPKKNPLLIKSSILTKKISKAGA